MSGHFSTTFFRVLLSSAITEHMSDWPANPLNPFPSHRGLGDESFTYVAPLRASEPLVLKVPTQSPQDRSKRSRAPSNRLYNDHVWNAAMYLADAICAGELDVEGKRVLELGAGIGLPSMLAAMKGAERVGTKHDRHGNPTYPLLIPDPCE